MFLAVFLAGMLELTYNTASEDEEMDDLGGLVSARRQDQSEHVRVSCQLFVSY